MTNKKDKAVHLFWTGGWDSTFRLLSLVLIYKKMVQPFYIMDVSRLSLNEEIKTMALIKKKLADKYPDTKELILPTIFKNATCLKENPGLVEEYQKVCTKYSIGKQYPWLAAFCMQQKMFDMELCLIKTEDGVCKLFRSKVTDMNLGEGDSVKVMEKNDKWLDLYHVFRYFRYPVLDLTKMDIHFIARENGFDDLLEMTWFCHKPGKNSRACGICKPCIIVINEGLGRRVPLTGRIRNKIYVGTGVRNWLIKHPRLFNFVRGRG